MGARGAGHVEQQHGAARNSIPFEHGLVSLRSRLARSCSFRVQAETPESDAGIDRARMAGSQIVVIVL